MHILDIACHGAFLNDFAQKFLHFFLFAHELELYPAREASPGLAPFFAFSFAFDYFLVEFSLFFKSILLILTVLLKICSNVVCVYLVVLI